MVPKRTAVVIQMRIAQGTMIVGRISVVQQKLTQSVEGRSQRVEYASFGRLITTFIIKEGLRLTDPAV